MGVRHAVWLFDRDVERAGGRGMYLPFSLLPCEYGPPNIRLQHDALPAGAQAGATRGAPTAAGAVVAAREHVGAAASDGPARRGRRAAAKARAGTGAEREGAGVEGSGGD